MHHQNLRLPPYILQSDTHLLYFTFFPTDLERNFNCIGKSLRNYPDMPFPPDQYLCDISNTLIVEERNYDITAMTVGHKNLHSNLNADQMAIYNAVIESVYNKKGQVFFVYGSGGVVKPSCGGQSLQD